MAPKSVTFLQSNIHFVTLHTPVILEQPLEYWDLATWQPGALLLSDCSNCLKLWTYVLICGCVVLFIL